ncbi:MAG TPA: universal stress protein [Planctomycetota bacterium]
MRLILVCVDFSDVTGKVVEKASAWAADLKAAVHLLHVIPPPPPMAVYAPGAGVALPMPTATLPDTAVEKAKLRDAALRLRDHGIAVTEELLEGPVIGEILAVAERVDPEAIVLGSHGHGALYELLVGSVTEGVLRRTRRPVWVVPSRS